MTLQHPHFNKRDDIQWLRALAILAVILFHVWPDSFPYGYLGVDIFFVISGYLMTLILLKPNSKSTITDFYLRRIKRIFPTCLFVISMTIFFGYFLLLWSHFLMLVSEATWSAFFINNLPTIFAHEKYFNLVSNIKFLLHTWSLGVEIQFYLLAPFLLRFINSRQKPRIWVLGGIGISGFLQLAIPFQEISFGLVFCRIWQFLIGAFAYYFSATVFEKQSPSKISKMLYAFFWTLLIILCLCQFSSDKNAAPFLRIAATIEKNKNAAPILRLAATVLAGILLQKGTENLGHLPKTANCALVYIGDASYSLYLVHWPVLIFCRYFGVLNYYGSLPVVVAIIFIAVIIHECFEKPFTTYSSWKINAMALAIFYATIVGIKMTANPYQQPDVSFGIDSNLHNYNPILANEYEAVSCDHAHYPCDEGEFQSIPKWGKYKPFCTYNLDPSSNKTAVILGNSYAYMQSKGILTALKQSKMKFRKVYFLIAFGCNQITGDFDSSIAKECRTADELHSKFLFSLKPDVIVFSALLMQIKELYPIAPPPKEIIKSPIYPQLRNLLRYANYAKKFIIIEPNPGMTEAGTYKTPLSIAEALIAGKDLSLFKKYIKTYERNDENAWKWIQPVIEECKNCRVVTTKDIFCNAVECDFIDRKSNLGLYCDDGHISPRTSFKLIPKLLHAIDN